MAGHPAPAGHIQVAQVPGRHEPDDQGEINYSFVFQTLRSLGYEGWIGCEYIPRGTSTSCTLLLQAMPYLSLSAGKTEDGLGWAAPFLSKD